MAGNGYMTLAEFMYCLELSTLLMCYDSFILLKSLLIEPDGVYLSNDKEISRR